MLNFWNLSLVKCWDNVKRYHLAKCFENVANSNFDSRAILRIFQQTHNAFSNFTTLHNWVRIINCFSVILLPHVFVFKLAPNLPPICGFLHYASNIAECFMKTSCKVEVKSKNRSVVRQKSPVIYYTKQTTTLRNRTSIADVDGCVVDAQAGSWRRISSGHVAERRTNDHAAQK